MFKRSRVEEFVSRAQYLHGQRYDYSRVAYRNSYTPILIVCKQHGAFEQKPSVHLRGSGCPLCATNKQAMSRREFLQKAHEVHGDKYDYSNVEYRNARIPVSIICKTHGVFTQTPDNHLRGMGCLHCGREQAASKRRHTTEVFLKRAAEVHGRNYDYSNVKYVNGRSRITIVCPKHGAFEQAGNAHLAGRGCQECAKETRGAAKRASRDDFIRKAQEVHGDAYDYSRVDYQLGTKPVIIICRNHGVFEQMPSGHLRGAGCPKCTNEASKKRQRWTDARFISKAIQVHGDIYDYSRVRYKTARTSVTIVCKEHGPFGQVPYAHLQGTGCPQCAIISRGKKQATNFDEFVAEANEIHKGKYSYEKSKLSYINLSTRIVITCPYHGDFKQRAESHVRGTGCPSCCDSYGERRTADWLERNGIAFERQKTFDGLTGKGEKPLSFDFYIPEVRVLIEFDGIQHVEPIRRFGGQAKFERIQERDRVKNVWAKMHGYSLVRIQHHQIEVIEETLESIFGAEWLKLQLSHVTSDVRSDINKSRIDDRVAKVLEAVKSKGGTIIEAGYAGARAKIKIRCSNGHTWDARPDHLKNGVWCPFCARNMKLNLEEMQRMAAERGGRCLSQNYVNAQQKLRWQCAKGHEWETAPMYIRRGRWCRDCARRNRETPY